MYLPNPQSLNFIKAEAEKLKVSYNQDGTMDLACFTRFIAIKEEVRITTLHARQIANKKMRRDLLKKANKEYD